MWPRIRCCAVQRAPHGQIPCSLLRLGDVVISAVTVVRLERSSSVAAECDRVELTRVVWLFI